MKTEHFTKYISKGFSVFPVILSKNGEKIDKKPAVDWKIYQTRFATEDEINVWCTLLDFNAIGMVTGQISGVTVLDVDDKNTTYGFDSPVKTKTISGGTHLWYKWRAGIRNTVRIGGKPIDVRGDGGFVVIPPSEFDDKKYEWISYEFDKLGDFPELPKQEVYKPVMTDLPTASSGNRNQTAIQVAGHLTAKIKQDAWETIGWLAFKQWNDVMVAPPISDFELRTTWESACRMNFGKHNDNSSMQVFFGQDIKTKYTQQMKEWGDGLSTGYPILDEFFTLVPEHLYLISSPTHQGKTTIALNIASKVASYGEQVLFCSLEQGLFISPRIETILGGKIPESLGILESSSMVSSEKLVEVIDSLAIRPRLVVIDHLHFMKKDLKNGITGGIDKMIIDLQNSAKKLKIPMIVISHLRKLNENKVPELDDLRDSSSLSQVPSVIIQMVKDQDENTIDESFGSFYIRKNRITGKMAKLGYEIENSGNVRIYKYQEKLITLKG
ncbi:MAG: bifunctional DNA primase/polymerase [Sphaerospermopsis sp.]|nr:bifunctional DNA primase/polymerase [Sphaerospermopsis sp.]